MFDNMWEDRVECENRGEWCVFDLDCDNTLADVIKDSVSAATQLDRTPGHHSLLISKIHQLPPLSMTGHHTTLCSYQRFYNFRHSARQDTRTPLSDHITDYATAATHHDRTPEHLSLIVSKIHQLPLLSMKGHQSPLIKIWWVLDKPKSYSFFSLSWILYY